MDTEERQARREAQRVERQRRRRRGAVAALGLVVVAVVVVVVTSSGGSSPTSTPVAAVTQPPTTTTAAHASTHVHHHHTTASVPTSTVSPTAPATGHATNTPIPILMYHVIANPLPGVPYPGLYVPVTQFAAQMKALKADGWHAVTQDQALAHWRHGTSLGPGKPIVLSFDNGYHSQYASAMPILRKLGWAGVENIQLTGLPPSQGGLSRKEVRTLLADGWELDTQGISHADLVTLDATQLHHQIVDARRTLEHRYHVIVDWFCYPSGHYDATVVSAVRAAGFVGSTTVIPGWAHGTDDRYRLSRLRVLGGTTPQQLLAQIDDSKAAGPAPASYTSAG
jgi:peptidoglycan/xylan/chitin deacetylase (PgdA/CDA1 family)